MVEKTFGSRAEVWHGTAKKTSGGLRKQHLMKNKGGRIVSRKKHFTAKKEMRLVKHGFTAKKGKFGYVKVTPHSRKNGGRRGCRNSGKRGGGGVNFPLSPSHYDGKGVGTSGVDLQFVAGNAG